jgi:hypothetical protein
MNTETIISTLGLFVAFFVITTSITTTFAIPIFADLGPLTVNKAIEQKAPIVPPNAPAIVPPHAPTLAPSLANLTGSINNTK